MHTEKYEHNLGNGGDVDADVDARFAKWQRRRLGCYADVAACLLGSVRRRERAAVRSRAAESRRSSQPSQRQQQQLQIVVVVV